MAPPKGGIRPPADLRATPFELFAPVYRAAAVIGVSSLEVDDMEVWQVASALGVGMDTDEIAGAAALSDGPPPPGALFAERARRLREQRGS